MAQDEGISVLVRATGRTDQRGHGPLVMRRPVAHALLRLGLVSANR
ncbi:MAG: hypothetical protein QOH39_2393 [Verrucomicrobiota bacterium]|jgi:hypothetical protein